MQGSTAIGIFRIHVLVKSVISGITVMFILSSRKFPEGTENLAYEDETTFSTPNSKRLKKKKEKNDSDRWVMLGNQSQ